MKDAINPDYYKVGGIETHDFIKAKLTKGAYCGWLQGSIIKYIARYTHKHNARENRIEDLEKAKWYLTKLIEAEKTEHESSSIK